LISWAIDAYRSIGLPIQFSDFQQTATQFSLSFSMIVDVNAGPM
jgi:hypothetical protein